MDVARELSEAIRALDANRRLMQSSFNRWKDTKIEEEHFKEIVELGLETLDVALDAQRRQTQAAAAFYSALCEYNKVIALIHRRKGTILAYSGVAFAEGPWAGKAYQDASENARRRGASRPMNYGWTRPQVISQGSISAPSSGCGPDGCLTDVIPTEGHIGHSIGTEYYDEGNVIYGDPMMQGEGIDGILPPPRNGTGTPSQIFPSPNQGSSNEVVPGFVRQVGYEEPAQRTTRRQPATPSIVQAKTATLKAQPLRDSSTQNTKRMPQNGNLTTDVGSNNSTDAMPSSNSGRTQPAVKRNMNWEQFGLTRPDTQNSQTQAAIKSK